jgi:hypothetical protein
MTKTEAIRSLGELYSVVEKSDSSSVHVAVATAARRVLAELYGTLTCRRKGCSNPAERLYCNPKCANAERSKRARLRAALRLEAV